MRGGSDLIIALREAVMSRGLTQAGVVRRLDVIRLN